MCEFNCSQEMRCVLTALGYVACCSALLYQNKYGNLGMKDTVTRGDSSSSPFTGATVDLGGRNATAISCGGKHVCATLSTNELVCWGDNSSGEHSSTRLADVPVA